MDVSDCSKNHVKSKETDTAIFISTYYTKPQRAECPGTERREQHTVQLDQPLGSRPIIDGIPPDPTRQPDTVATG
jgi:hypothetical protein